MKKHFYSHIIDNEPLMMELGELDLEKEEREELENMMEASLHHAILEAILDELSEEDKQIFLHHITHETHEKVLEHLRGRIEHIEVKIKKTADTMMEELYKDIKSVKDDTEELES